MEKRTLTLCFTAVLLACSLLIYVGTQNQDEPETTGECGFHVYADPEFKHEITYSLSTLNFNATHLGCNNWTIYVVNEGEYPMRIFLMTFALPVNWSLTLSDYEGGWILPGEVWPLTLTLYVPYWIDFRLVRMGGYFIIEQVRLEAERVPYEDKMAHGRRAKSSVGQGIPLFPFIILPFGCPKANSGPETRYSP